jgi:N-formylglutamate amidohydrolase
MAKLDINKIEGSMSRKTINNNSWVILHIPHASYTIPKDIRNTFKLTKDELNLELSKLTDHYTDILFEVSGHDEIKIVFPISRMAVDPERFVEDSKEEMAKCGQGVLYTHTTDGKLFRTNQTSHQRKEILKKYYIPHHKQLEQYVQNALDTHGKALIIDCHSFPQIPLPMDRNKTIPRPDICLGSDSYHTSETLLKVLKEKCAKNSWTVKVNQPYSGTMIPLRYYQKDTRVQSIMIEVNRGLYMIDEPMDLGQSTNYENTRLGIRGLIDSAKNILY